jgi:hypothetical protein
MRLYIINVLGVETMLNSWVAGRGREPSVLSLVLLATSKLIGLLT